MMEEKNELMYNEFVSLWKTNRLLREIDKMKDFELFYSEYIIRMSKVKLNELLIKYMLNDICNPKNIFYIFHEQKILLDFLCSNDEFEKADELKKYCDKIFYLIREQIKIGEKRELVKIINDTLNNVFELKIKI